MSKPTFVNGSVGRACRQLAGVFRPPPPPLRFTRCAACTSFRPTPMSRVCASSINRSRGCLRSLLPSASSSGVLRPRRPPNARTRSRMLLHLDPADSSRITASSLSIMLASTLIVGTPFSSPSRWAHSRSAVLLLPRGPMTTAANGACSSCCRHWMYYAMERCSSSRPARHGGSCPGVGSNGQEFVADPSWPCIALRRSRIQRRRLCPEHGTWPPALVRVQAVGMAAPAPGSVPGCVRRTSKVETAWHLPSTFGRWQVLILGPRFGASRHLRSL